MKKGQICKYANTPIHKCAHNIKKSDSGKLRIH